MRMLSPFIALSTLMLAACSEPETAVKDVDYFMKHPQDLTKTLSECNNNPGELAMTPNCMNAAKADKNMFLDQAQKAAGR